MNPFIAYNLVALLLLGLGFFGLIHRKTLIGMLISVELMLNGAGLSLVAAGRLTKAQDFLGQSGTLMIMGLAAAEATLVLAIILSVVKRLKTTEADKVSKLKG